MSVETVLSKICDHNTDVLGCIVTSGERVYANLPDLYDLVDAREVGEYAANMFAVTGGLDTDQDAFDQMFMELGHHSFYVRKLDDGVLVLLNKPMQRASFKKMQVGVNLFMKPLRRAFDEAAPAADPVSETDGPRTGDPVTPTSRRRWF